MLRKADFGQGKFYCTFRLLEVISNWPANPTRSYALVRLDANGEVDLRPLDGKSEVIHNANQETDELHLETDERREAYLRFFCWATDGENGSFLIPRSFHSVPYVPSTRPEVSPAVENIG